MLSLMCLTANRSFIGKIVLDENRRFRPKLVLIVAKHNSQEMRAKEGLVKLILFFNSNNSIEN